MIDQKPVSLYIHIPFCLRKCLYCDFLSGRQTEKVREQYVQALLCEIRCQRDCPRGTEADTVFFGGGTPSVLTADQICRILEGLRESFRILPDAEISLEMNPGTADAAKLQALRETGVNRLSIGVQSMHDEELRLLGRIHTKEQAEEAFRLARAAGFDNINLDLMSALPGQSFEKWAKTLAEAVRWNPEHISAYSLIIEPGTPFAAMQESGTLPPLPEEETDRRMYHFTQEYLGQHGYRRYEISNYAKPGRECMHNSGYWTGHPYLGFGTGAASCIGGRRFSNCADLQTYLRQMTALCSEGGGEACLSADCSAGIRTEVQRLTKEDRIEEFMFLGLRMTAGVRAEDFYNRFGLKMEELYGEILRGHIEKGVLERTPQGYCLTERGLDVSNYVLADYLF